MSSSYNSSSSQTDVKNAAMLECQTNRTRTASPLAARDSGFADGLYEHHRDDRVVSEDVKGFDSRCLI